MVETCVEEAGGKVPVIAGAADCGTRRTLQNLRLVRAAGADCAHVIPPYYFAPSQAELLDHYTVLAEEGGLPLVLYNNPAVSRVNMDVQTIARLASLSPIIGLKESSGDLRHFQQVVYALGDAPQVAVLGGSDQLAHASLLVGGRGLVCSFACVTPHLYTGIYEAARRGDLAAGRDCQRQLVSLARVIFGSAGSIALTKYAHSLLGLCSPRMCAPLAPAPPEAQARVAGLLRELGVLS
jgi:4-hydroxy-tetrahydrodipicolinate synthase